MESRLLNSEELRKDCKFAIRRADSLAESQGIWNLIIILKGLLAAENVNWQNIDMVALRGVSFKYQAIPQEISGL